jgi:2-C-methyl-D-erythritol 4-phosphate cytidylyltransferase
MARDASAVVLAAGRGTRLGTGRSKALHPLLGHPLLWYSLRAFSASGCIDEIVVVTRPEDLSAVRELTRTHPSAVCVLGGDTRRASSHAGVAAASGTIVLIHDAARAGVTPELIRRVHDGVRRHGACVPVVALHDTLRAVQDGVLQAGTTRGRDLRGMQTPQGFERRRILTALEGSGETLVDDAEALLRAGETVAVVEGDPANIKLTTPADLALMTAILEAALRATGPTDRFEPVDAAR